MAMRALTASLGLAASLVLASCSPTAAPEAESEAAASTEVAPLKAPAGAYKLDPAHASIFFRVSHIGLSNYVMRFTKFDADINFDPADVTKSSIVVTIDPKSVSADFPFDYKATLGKERGFDSWDDEVALSPRFLNANEHGEITFRSTRIEQTGPNTARVTGDLTLVGQTHPVTMETKLIGSTDNHVMNGGGAFGIQATTTFDRAQFGIPPMGDGTVTLEFNGEFNQVVATPAS